MHELIPRIWIDRDPRNGGHVNSALYLITRLTTEAFATPQTLAELKRFGIFPNMRVGNPDTVDCVIGGFFFLDQGKLFPDNLLTTCAECRAPLQIRPHADRAARKLCCFCAVDALLAEHHAKSAQ